MFGTVYLSIPSRDEEVDKLTDVYCEEMRLSAKCSGFGLAHSPLEYWRDHLEDVYHNARRPSEFSKQMYGESKGRTDISARELREVAYTLVAETKTFRLSWLRPLLNYLISDVMRIADDERSGFRILDPCAGWGDRLLGACLEGVGYFGTDPHSRLPRCYDAIIEEHGDPMRHGYASCCFEDVDLGEQTFDLALTSPPFFDYEMYEESKRQSDQRYPTLKLWISDFFLVMITKTWQHLRSGGVLAMYVCDFYAQPGRERRMSKVSLCDIMNSHLGSFRDASYLGVIGLMGGKTRPCWVWRKR
jgi:hypothetical protein